MIAEYIENNGWQKEMEARKREAADRKKITEFIDRYMNSRKFPKRHEIKKSKLC